jgi:hypothetical protein
MNLARQFTESLAMTTQSDRSAAWAADCQTVKPAACGESRAEPDEPELASASCEAVQPPLGVGQIIELILKDRRRLDRIARASEQKVDLASRLLAISVTSFALYGLAMWLTFYSAHQWPQVVPPAEWLSSPQLPVVTFVEAAGPPTRVPAQITQLVVAYTFGLIAASGVCLPSLYFYSLLSGVRMMMPDVVVHTLKGMGVTAVALIGILPVYSALALGAIVLPVRHEVVSAIFGLGLCLPFVAGLWGTRSLFVGFVDLCHTMPAEFQVNRACFLRRLILSWCACYTAVAPLMIVTVWRHLGS